MCAGGCVCVCVCSYSWLCMCLVVVEHIFEFTLQLGELPVRSKRTYVIIYKSGYLQDLRSRSSLAARARVCMCVCVRVICAHTLSAMNRSTNGARHLEWHPLPTQHSLCIAQHPTPRQTAIPCAMAQRTHTHTHMYERIPCKCVFLCVRGHA